MNSKYCLFCNAKTDFSDILPKFCQACGKPFASSVAASITLSISNTQPIKPKSIITQDEEDDSPQSVPEITNLEFEIDGSSLSGEQLLRQRGHLSYKDIKNSPFRERVAIKDIGKTIPPITRPKSKGRPQKIDIKKWNEEFYGEVVKIKKDNSEVGE